MCFWTQVLFHCCKQSIQVSHIHNAYAIIIIIVIIISFIIILIIVTINILFIHKKLAANTAWGCTWQPYSKLKSCTEEWFVFTVRMWECVCLSVFLLIWVAESKAVLFPAPFICTRLHPTLWWYWSETVSVREASIFLSFHWAEFSQSGLCFQKWRALICVWLAVHFLINILHIGQSKSWFVRQTSVISCLTFFKFRYNSPDYKI